MTSCVSVCVNVKLLLLVDKSKLVILRLRQLYVVLPFTMAKIEVRVRNLLINQRKKMEGIERFVEFYLNQLDSKE
jgi:hypothetical protein